ncbi:hypothetical protein Hdeb2414_s0002g00044101 [Helianthus debilis subsp. tardiflorus]
MEQKLPLLTKKLCSLVQVIFFTLKKGISKRKLLLHFNMMMRSGKIAGKSIHNLSFPAPHSGEYEFSCRNTPHYPLSLFSNRKKHQKNNHRLSNSNPQLFVDDCDDITIDPTIIKVLNMMTSPAVEHLKITDSSAPVAHGLEDVEVDEAADKFIRRFYNDLRQQHK